MKVYNILATVVVEDNIDDKRIADVCNENIQKAVMEDFNIGNCIVHYELKEMIDFSDLPIRDSIGDDDYDDKYDEWIKKSQEVINRILVEMRNP